MFYNGGHSRLIRDVTAFRLKESLVLCIDVNIAQWEKGVLKIVIFGHIISYIVNVIVNFSKGYYLGSSFPFG